MSGLSEYLSKKSKKKMSFAKGTKLRKIRGKLAEGLKIHKDKVNEPFALATWMAKKGYKPRKEE